MPDKQMLCHVPEAVSTRNHADAGWYSAAMLQSLGKSLSLRSQNARSD